MKKLALITLFLLFATVLARKTLRASAYRVSADSTTVIPTPDFGFGDDNWDDDGLECDDDDFMLA